MVSLPKSNRQRRLPTFYHQYLLTTMKISVLTLLSTLSIASGFAPQYDGRQSTNLFLTEGKTAGTVKWRVILI